MESIFQRRRDDAVIQLDVAVPKRALGLLLSGYFRILYDHMASLHNRTVVCGSRLFRIIQMAAT